MIQKKTGSAIRKDATIKLLKIKLRQFDLDNKVLRKKIAKVGLDISDLTDEIEEVKREEEEEANKPFTSELTKVDVSVKPPENAEEYQLNEIELIKFQNQTEIEEIKQDFEKQIEAINNKVEKIFKNFNNFCFFKLIKIFSSI